MPCGRVSPPSWKPPAAAAVFLSRVGALLLAADAAELEVMRARATARPAHSGCRTRPGPWCRCWVTTVGGLWSPHEAHVDNRALGEALAIAFLKAGGVLNANEAAVTASKPGPAVLHALWPL